MVAPKLHPALRTAIDSTRLESEELSRWLEWAGTTLLSMQLSSPLPKGPHTSWPAYKQEATTAYGYTQSSFRQPPPGAEEIALMDKILVLPSLVTDIDLRRLLNARALVKPFSGKHLYGWTKLGKMLHADPRLLARHHEKALAILVRLLSREKVDTIRQSFVTLSLFP